MAYKSHGPLECKVYVGNLGNQGCKGELERVFGYYGSLRNVWVARNPPGFAFVEFDDARDAEDSVNGLDGRTICGVRARVELSSGRTRRGGSQYDSRQDRGRGSYGGDRRDSYKDRRRSKSRSPRRRYPSRSRSKSRDRGRRSRSYSPRNNRYDRRGASGSPRRNRSISPVRRSSSSKRSFSRSRSRSSER